MAACRLRGLLDGREHAHRPCAASRRSAARAWRLMTRDDTGRRSVDQRHQITSAPASDLRAYAALRTLLLSLACEEGHRIGPGDPLSASPPNGHQEEERVAPSG